jgi:hypothetical protein
MPRESVVSPPPADSRIGVTRTWRRSTFCGDRTCVEVAAVDDSSLMRDSKKPENLALPFTQTEWGLFLAGVHAGEFDSAIVQRRSKKTAQRASRRERNRHPA